VTIHKRTMFCVSLIVLLMIAGTFWKATAQTNPKWKIVYRYGDLPSFDIWVANSDGTENKPLTKDGNSYWPSWSPDGLRIAYSYRDWPISELRVMDADGTNARTLRKFGIVRAIAWSPDGKQLAVACLPLGKNGATSIDLLPADGEGEPHVLVSEGDRPAWSPDGKTILFSSRKGDGHWGLYSIGVDGTAEKQLVGSPPEVITSAFSPDGKWIAYDGEDRWSKSIFVMAADGSNRHSIVTGECNHPSWLPDSERIAFSCSLTPADCARSISPGNTLAYGASPPKYMQACQYRLFVASRNDTNPKLVPLFDSFVLQPEVSPRWLSH
jgi:Tol biopolymer transport system component